MPALAKRDDEFLIPKPVIVILIMLGAIFLVCCGYAVHSAFGFGTDHNKLKPLSNAQQEYMAEVRVRNMDALAYEGAVSRGDYSSWKGKAR
jgi:hypothetical protein